MSFVEFVDGKARTDLPYTIFLKALAFGAAKATAIKVPGFVEFYIVKKPDNNKYVFTNSIVKYVNSGVRQYYKVVAIVDKRPYRSETEDSDFPYCMQVKYELYKCEQAAGGTRQDLLLRFMIPVRFNVLILPKIEVDFPITELLEENPELARQKIESVAESVRRCVDIQEADLARRGRCAYCVGLLLRHWALDRVFNPRVVCVDFALLLSEVERLCEKEPTIKRVLLDNASLLLLVNLRGSSSLSKCWERVKRSFTPRRLILRQELPGVYICRPDLVCRELVRKAQASNIEVRSFRVYEVQDLVDDLVDMALQRWEVVKQVLKLGKSKSRMVGQRTEITVYVIYKARSSTTLRKRAERALRELEGKVKFEHVSSGIVKCVDIPDRCHMLVEKLRRAGLEVEIFIELSKATASVLETIRIGKLTQELAEARKEREQKLREQIAREIERFIADYMSEVREGTRRERR